MKTKNIDVAVKAAELLEKGKCVYIHPAGGNKELEPSIVSEFPIINIKRDYIEIIDCYLSVKIKRRVSYLGEWPQGEARKLPTHWEIDLIRRNLSKVNNYIKLPKKYWKNCCYFWITIPGRYGKRMDKDSHWASQGMFPVSETKKNYEKCWIIEVIR